MESNRGHRHEGGEGRSVCWKYAAVSGAGAGTRKKQKAKCSEAQRGMKKGVNCTLESESRLGLFFWFLPSRDCSIHDVREHVPLHSLQIFYSTFWEGVSIWHVLAISWHNSVKLKNRVQNSPKGLLEVTIIS